MSRFIALCLLATTIASAPVPASGAEQHSPFSDVPLTHWSYTAMRQLEQRGLFTGYPDRTFNGRRALTRYEFAVATHRVGRELSGPSRPEETSPLARLRRAVIRKLGLSQNPAAPVAVLQNVNRLVREFDAELAMLGADTERLHQNLEVMEPQGAALDIPDRPERESAARTKGAEEARTEWSQGKVTLYTYGGPGGGGPSLDILLGIPYKGIAGCIVDQGIMDRAAGHNEEVYRLTLERGLPPNSRRPWLDLILSPENGWRDPKHFRAWLDEEKPEAASPDGQIVLRLKPGEASKSTCVDLRLPGQVLEFYLHGYMASPPRVEAVWGPPRSDLLLLRYPGRSGDRPVQQFMVLDLRTIQVLKRKTVDVR